LKVTAVLRHGNLFFHCGGCIIEKHLWSRDDVRCSDEYYEHLHTYSFPDKRILSLYGYHIRSTNFRSLRKRTTDILFNYSAHLPFYVGPCHHVMARLRVTVGGDGFQIWRVAVNIVNKQSRTANAWSSSLGIRRGRANNSP
jgi:hypothetical protein